MRNTIIVFTLRGCFHCKLLKSKLNQENIGFTEIEVSDNQKIWDQVVEQTGHNVLPTVFVKKEDSDDGPVFVPNRDFKNQDDLVEKLKNYL